jgi:peptidoglycan/xylan/chitin deacetylase (PgdA/CDA1 family)
MKRIALKIDVGTYQGTRTGAPALAELLQRHGAQASFFFALGPDQGGREARAGSLKSYHGLASRLYGCLLPAPDIGARCRDVLRAIGDAGFETGIHAWNRVRWERCILDSANELAESELYSACRRFEDVFGTTPKAHAAAGWRASRHALRLEQRKGFLYASDCRGSHPFFPVVQGEPIACLQIPTTLPTLDELLALEPGLTPDRAMDRLLQLSRAIPGDHVFTLRAELEGMKFLGPFEKLLAGWQSNGCSLVALRDIHASLDAQKLPKCVVDFAAFAGRAGIRMAQGDAFPNP